MVLTRTVANGCGRLRTVANGCGRGRNVERTHSNPQTPRVKREPLLRIRGKNTLTPPTPKRCCAWSLPPPRRHQYRSRAPSSVGPRRSRRGGPHPDPWGFLHGEKHQKDMGSQGIDHCFLGESAKKSMVWPKIMVKTTVVALSSMSPQSRTYVTSLSL